MPDPYDMNPILRLLMVEDSPDDEALVLRAIRKGGFSVEHKRVENREDLLTALKSEDWDIVLSDFQMPVFNGLAALKTVKEQDDNLPFILISGTIGEEMAVEAMRAGAQDYLMKDNLTRLVPAIRRELDDAEERKALHVARETLRHQAYHDVLTGLPNRWLLRDRLQQALVYSRSAKGSLAVMFLDLDRFKNLNDTLGHLVGDQLLRAVATRLQGALYERDTLARLGGDDFVVLLADISNEEHIKLVAERLLRLLDEPFILEGKEVYVDASMGIALHPQNGDQVDALIRNAESAMYFAKEKGRNNYQFSSSEIQAATADRFVIENELHAAIRSQQLQVFYQPQFSLSRGGVTGVEALVRWEHPDKGTLPPDKFIPVAEETGQIIALGEFVLRRAVEDMVGLRKLGCDIDRLAVNLSARQLFHNETPDLVRCVLSENDVPSDFLEVEITESGVMQDPEQAVQTLKSIGEMGVSIAIDDFGTGYSSLSYLKRFPINILKIDRSFVREITLDPDDEAIVRTVVAMARALGLRVIAEGVETKEQQAFLDGLGCDEAQGYYYARPMTLEDLKIFFQNCKSD